jgi:hypothetical protein
LNYEDARDKCKGEDSDLVVVNTFAENKYIYDFANRDQVDVWLGIRENVSLLCCHNIPKSSMYIIPVR